MQRRLVNINGNKLDVRDVFKHFYSVPQYMEA